MKRLLAISMFLGLVFSSVSLAWWQVSRNYTVTITSQSELAAINAERLEVNAHRQGQEPKLVALTEAQFIQWIVDTQVVNYVAKHQEKSKRDVAEAFETASEANKATIRTLLGL